MGNVLAPLNRRTLSVKDAAEYIGVSATNFRQNIAPAIKALRITPRRIVYLVEDVDAYINHASGKKPANQPETGWEEFT